MLLCYATSMINMMCIIFLFFWQGILGKHSTRIKHFITTRRIQMDKQCFSLGIFLMPIIIHFMTTGGGTHGEDSLRGVLLTKLGYGLLGIMSSISPQKL